MIYNYETLGDDRFQQFSQALLAAAFPNVQCLPINQPDGGRDAFYPIMRPDGSKRELVIFQVKYSRDPNSKEERDVISQAIKTESEKVRLLKNRGAVAYYLITNVAGTSHLGTGSIDKVNADLESAFGIPSYCWWRDDLDARVNSNSDVKWSFLEILRGTDILQLLLDRSSGESSEGRFQAIQSYIAAQHDADAEVKFKQVELQNRLLDLFVDLPIARPNGGIRRPSNDTYYGRRTHITGIDDIEFYEVTGEAHRRRPLPNAASFLLRNPLDSRIRKIVLEGAPGQGKSTITQYLCQANRIRLLQNEKEQNTLPEYVKDCPVRIPFRVDLRDYASWVSGRNPFVAVEGSAPTPSGQTSLESFIAAQVSHESGGHAFTVSDLTFIAKSSHIAIVLDGLDEVAKIEIRKRVIEEINKSATRLHSNARSILFVVTSRPSAFANSPGFSSEEWMHLEIQSMTLSQISEYSDKWMTARNLPSRERFDFKKLLKEKLDQPHTRDLSRNPMQLTILLALIQLRGLSLPDKRTTLYDSYMEHFFNREAEKSSVVRDHRDLLIDIHRYLAWVLHVQSETGAGAGSISEGELKALLRKYLEAKGHNPQLVDALFSGMVERVVALVSRVQGTYEFEVQPMREYFAARHLYQTAPYSPPGGERKGTKPERFNALSRNFYWLNVARFFCGCFSSGELSSLADGLIELSKSDDYRLLSHPGRLSLMLLGDWVFNQEPLAAKRVVQSLFDQPGLKILSAQSNRPGSAMVLPEHCGREILEGKAGELLDRSLSHEDRQAVLDIVRLNCSPQQALGVWKVREPLDEDTRQRKVAWLADGLRLGVFSSMQLDDVQLIAKKYKKLSIDTLSEAGLLDVIWNDEELCDEAISRVLGTSSFQALPLPPGDLSNALHILAMLVSPSVIGAGFALDYGWPLSESSRRIHGAKRIANVPEPNKPWQRKLWAITEQILLQYQESTSIWTTSLAPWSAVARSLHTGYGECWAASIIAIIGSGIRSPIEKGTWSDAGWRGGGDICERMRYARLKSGNLSWWRGQIDEVLTGEGIELAALAFATWATPRTILELGDQSTKLFDALTETQWGRVVRAFNSVRQALRRRETEFTATVPRKDSSPRLMLIMGQRGTTPYALNIYERGLKNYERNDSEILTFCCDCALALAESDVARWPEALEVVASSYAKGNTSRIRDVSQQLIPPSIARRICSDAERFPQRLVLAAEQCLAASVGAEAPKLGAVAQQGHWFDY